MINRLEAMLTNGAPVTHGEVMSFILAWFLFWLFLTALRGLFAVVGFVIDRVTERMGAL